MNHIKPRAALRTLRAFAAPHDLNTEALRLPDPQPYRPHEQTIVPEAELVSSTDDAFAWCEQHEVGNMLMYARWTAVARSQSRGLAKRAARILADREGIRIGGREPPSKTGLTCREVAAGMSALWEWEANGQPFFIDMLRAGQVLVATRRRKLRRAADLA